MINSNIPSPQIGYSNALEAAAGGGRIGQLYGPGGGIVGGRAVDGQVADRNAAWASGYSASDAARNAQFTSNQTNSANTSNVGNVGSSAATLPARPSTAQIVQALNQIRSENSTALANAQAQNSAAYSQMGNLSGADRSNAVSAMQQANQGQYNQLYNMHQSGSVYGNNNPFGGEVRSYLNGSVVQTPHGAKFVPGADNGPSAQTTSKIEQALGGRENIHGFNANAYMRDNIGDRWAQASIDPQHNSASDLARAQGQLNQEGMARTGDGGLGQMNSGYMNALSQNPGNPGAVNPAYGPQVTSQLQMTNNGNGNWVSGNTDAKNLFYAQSSANSPYTNPGLQGYPQGTQFRDVPAWTGTNNQLKADPSLGLNPSVGGQNTPQFGQALQAGSQGMQQGGGFLSGQQGGNIVQGPAGSPAYMNGRPVVGYVNGGNNGGTPVYQAGNYGIQNASNMTGGTGIQHVGGTERLIGEQSGIQADPSGQQSGLGDQMGPGRVQDYNSATGNQDYMAGRNFSDGANSSQSPGQALGNAQANMGQQSNSGQQFHIGQSNIGQIGQGTVGQSNFGQSNLTQSNIGQGVGDKGGFYSNTGQHYSSAESMFAGEANRGYGTTKESGAPSPDHWSTNDHGGGSRDMYSPTGEKYSSADAMYQGEANKGYTTDQNTGTPQSQHWGENSAAGSQGPYADIGAALTSQLGAANGNEGSAGMGGDAGSSGAAGAMGASGAMPGGGDMGGAGAGAGGGMPAGGDMGGAGAGAGAPPPSGGGGGGHGGGAY